MSGLPLSSERHEASRIKAAAYAAWRRQSPIWAYQSPAQFDIPDTEPGSVRKHMREFEDRVRKASRGRNCLFHGTTYPLTILVANRLEIPWVGELVVSLTRAAAVSVHFATLFREDSEERGAVLVFDRETPRTRYRIEPANDATMIEPAVKDGEFEERIDTPIDDVARHLIAVVWGPRNCR